MNNVLNIKAEHQLLLACRAAGRPVGNPNARVPGFLHSEMEKNYKSL